jgi:hypothetical protein
MTLFLTIQRKGRYSMKISNVIVAVLVIYSMLCFGEILMKNTHENPQYSSWNIVTTMVNKLDN